MIKTVKDYIPQLKEKFPYLSERDIRKIVEYGWRMIYRYTIYGCDINIKSNSNNFWFYLGYLTRDSVKHYNYYINKLRKKFRILYHSKYKKKDWDGYYYIGLTESELEDFDRSLNRVGRKRKHYTFKNKVMYKIEDESKIMYNWSRCILRFKYLTDMGDSFVKKVITVDNPEVVLRREHPANFKDIMVSSNNYILI